MTVNARHKLHGLKSEMPPFHVIYIVIKFVCGKGLKEFFFAIEATYSKPLNKGCLYIYIQWKYSNIVIIPYSVQKPKIKIWLKKGRPYTFSQIFTLELKKNVVNKWNVLYLFAKLIYFITRHKTRFKVTCFLLIIMNENLNYYV